MNLKVNCTIVCVNIKQVAYGLPIFIKLDLRITRGVKDDFVCIISLVRLEFK